MIVAVGNRKFFLGRAAIWRIDRQDKTVFVRRQGAGAGCPGALMTMKQGVE